MAFEFNRLVQYGKDLTEYRKIEGDFVSTFEIDGEEVIKIEPEALQIIAREAMKDVSFKLRPAHLEKVAKILDDPEASENDRFVAKTLLQNSATAIKGILPTCQDTGTAIVLGKKGQRVWTNCDDEFELSKGIFQTFDQENLRFSQMSPVDMFSEVNTKSNLPAQVDLMADQGSEYKFLFLAKGGGSANKTYLFQQTKSLLNPIGLETFMREKIKTLGTAACPPYHLAIVIGGTSAEFTMKMVKLASAGFLDGLPTEGGTGGHVYRDLEWEANIFQMTQELGIGAQFGGKYFAHDVKVIRAPRHGASCPVGMAVSCSADRNIKAKITRDGLFIEQMEENPGRLVPEEGSVKMAPAVEIDLDKPMEEVLAELSKYPVKTRLSLSGTIVVARDIAHARINDMLDRGEEMPDYMKKYPVYYAGPAKTPEGMPTGSFGPTTANRMDPYAERFQKAGGSLVMLAKGNRSQGVTDACQANGGFYLGSIGGPAAILAQENIKSVEVIDFEEDGMEAVRKITVENFPAFIIVDDKGNDFFKELV